MVILGIETSCDETAAAVLQKKGNSIQILSNVVASSAVLQAKYGGVIPEQAAREQLKSIIPVIETVINDSRLRIKDLDAIAVTQGPGLIGSLLVGVETAKTLAYVWNKPLIPVNHLIGHFYANWISPTHLRGVKAHLGGVPTFPCIGLLVSGGHTDLVLFTGHGKYEYLGGTRDDAAGECFDKCARLLGLPYPGGPAIAAEAAKLKVTGEKLKIELPRPLINEKTFDFSFSGLKTAVSNIVSEELRKTQKTRFAKRARKADYLTNRISGVSGTQSYSESFRSNLAVSIQAAIIDVLVKKTIKAAQLHKVNQIIAAGGVAANQELVRNLQCTIDNLQLKIALHVPPPSLCTDNAAMIASAAFFLGETADPLTLQANPNLSLAS